MSDVSSREFVDDGVVHDAVATTVDGSEYSSQAFQDRLMGPIHPHLLNGVCDLLAQRV